MEESKLVNGKAIMDSLTVARAGYAALHRGQTVTIPGVMNKLLAQSVRLMPRGTVARVVRQMQERVQA
jgi:hypothetical protein